jgi:MFS family permease
MVDVGRRRAVICDDPMMPNSVRVIGRVARDPRLRRIELGFVGFAIAEHGTWLASIMFAYDRGGVGEAGIAAVVLLAPALVVAPVAAFAADRFDSGRVLATGYAVQSVAMLLTALAIAGGASSLIVYAGAMVAASGITLTRPALGALLPRATHTPADLTAANVVLGFVEYTGMFIGPALTGILVGVSGLAAPFAVCGALTAVASLFALGLGGAGSHVDERTPRDGGPIHDTVEGLRALRGHRPVRMMITMLSLGSLVIGAADVLFVATADHLSDGDTSRAGLFGTAFGVGAVLGSMLTVVLVGRARLTPFIACAVAAMGLGLATLSTAGGVALAAVLYVVMGGGESVLRVSASTLIQRVAPTDVVGRFFGVAEGLHMFSIAIGSGLIGLLVTGAGYETGLLVAGVTVPILLLLRISPLFRLDRDAAVPDDRVLELILGDDIFAGLPAPTVERLAADVERRHVGVGTAVIAEGEPGDRYYVIDDGRVAVEIGGRHVRDLGRGDGFGELALLSDVPRTATVIATTELELLAFERERFLRAVTGNARSSGVGGARTDRYLGPAAG